MVKHEMRLHPRPFDKFLRGEKIYEMRLNDTKRALIAVGDVIEFVNRVTEARLPMDVVARHEFGTFLEMIRELPPVELGYNTPEWLARYQQGDHGMYEYYSPEDEARYGVVALEVRRCGT